MTNGRFRLVRNLRGTLDGIGEALRQATPLPEMKGDCDKAEVERMMQLIQRMNGIAGVNDGDK